MGSVSQDLFLSLLSLSLNRKVTMLFLPRLPLLLAIIFLGLFCLPQTITCQNQDCKVYEKTVLSKCTTPGAMYGNDMCDMVEKGSFCTAKCHPNGDGTWHVKLKCEGEPVRIIGNSHPPPIY